MIAIKITDPKARAIWLKHFKKQSFKSRIQIPKSNGYFLLTPGQARELWDQDVELTIDFGVPIKGRRFHTQDKAAHRLKRKVFKDSKLRQGTPKKRLRDMTPEQLEANKLADRELQINKLLKRQNKKISKNRMLDVPDSFLETGDVKHLTDIGIKVQKNG
jgi:hypothetical protein